MRRRLNYWGRILRSIWPSVMGAITGKQPTGVVIVLGIAGTILSAATIGTIMPYVPIVVGVGTVVIAIGEAVFREWDEWAPHEPPNVTIERSDWPDYAGIQITNNDPSATFKMKLMKLSGPNRQLLRFGPIEEPWPWDVIMSPGDLTVRLERGEPHRVPIVYFSRHSGRDFEFRVSRHRIRLPAEPDQRDLAITLRLYRVHPNPAAVDYEARVSWPRGL